jgi:tellurite resistance protein TehA-like permease
MGWWALVFPLASMTLSTLLIGRELNSAAFDVMGSAFTLAVTLLWVRIRVNLIWSTRARLLI